MLEVALLAALLRELDDPVTAAMSDLDRLRANMRRLVRRRRVLDIVCAELAGKRELLPSFQRRTVAKALATLDIDECSVVPLLRRSLAVMAVRGALDAVLQNLVRHALGSAVKVRGYERLPMDVAWPPGALPTLQEPVVVIEVTGSGSSIPESMRPKLFDFDCGANAQPEQSGSALALWISRLVVRAHGGDLWLADLPEGAAFVSVWPGAPPRQRQDEEEDKRPHSNMSLRDDGWPAHPLEFSQAVRRTREAAQLTREAFASHAQLADSTLRNVETQRHRCTHQTRLRIVQHFARLGIAPLLPKI